MTEHEGLPRGIGRPATGALRAAGFTELEQLHGVPATQLLELHGVGPTAIRVLAEALAQRGLTLG